MPQDKSLDANFRCLYSYKSSKISLNPLPPTNCHLLAFQKVEDLTFLNSLGPKMDWYNRKKCQNVLVYWLYVLYWWFDSLCICLLYKIRRPLKSCAILDVTISLFSGKRLHWCQLNSCLCSTKKHAGRGMGISVAGNRRRGKGGERPHDEVAQG